MYYAGIVRGSAAQAKPVIINVDTVYVHCNIKRVEIEDERIKNEDTHEEYEYEEIQFTLKEYLSIQQENIKNNEKDITDLQLALAELVEGGSL